MSIKSLASQTLWYGVSNILGRFLNYFLSLLLVYYYAPNATAPVQQVYTIIPFLNILFTLGLETSYFRFNQSEDKKKLFNTLSTLLLVTTLAFSLFLFLFDNFFIHAMEMERHRDYYYIMLPIVFLDTLSALPFVRLRQDGKPKKFALIKLINILINFFFVIFYLILIPRLAKQGITLPTWLYNPSFGIGYYIVANLIASLLTLVCLLPEWKGFRLSWDSPLLKKVMHYSIPILIVGFGGMINDFLSRIVYYKVLKEPNVLLDHEFGVFAANYKLAVLATLFIQVFKMGAEPFFFNQSKEKNAPETYARVMKWFVIICCFIFIGISMNLNILVKLIASGHKEYAEGISIVPVLTLANIFLGIYYNLAIWYKLKDQTMKGAIITFLGVVITVVMNIILIPLYHYHGAAYATLLCYTFMMVVSYLWGQTQYFIPYDVTRCLLYIGISILLYVLVVFFQWQFNLNNWWIGSLACFLSMGLLALLILKMDKKEVKNLPFVGKFIR